MMGVCVAGKRSPRLSPPLVAICLTLTIVFPAFGSSSSSSSSSLPSSSSSGSRVPMFVATIPNVTVTEGRDASLPCIVKDIGDYQVTWMHLNRQMLLTIDQRTITLIPRFSVSRDDPTTWTLHIQDVEPTDTGYYVCQVNMIPVINQVGFVQVVGVQQVESEELVLKSVTRKDMGAYLCIATNKVPPSISKRIVLDVHFHPVITVPNQLVGAPIDTSVTLECQVAAFPNAVHFWRFNDQLLINSSRQETQEIRKGYTTTMKLSLRNLKAKDFGTYVCAAKNSLGETESNVRLYEIEVNRRAEEKQEQLGNSNSVIRPERPNTDRMMDIWSKPGDFRAGLDSDSPSYTLEDDTSLERGGDFAGGLDGSGGSLGRTGFGPASSSSCNFRCCGEMWCSVWAACALVTAWLQGQRQPQPCIVFGFLLVAAAVAVSTPTLDLRPVLAHT
ncbi:lachesin-like isoform X4 [Portunus trituberculatus]|uniref:lachesin-like isoform X4 n=1 Tax=Portunus trituberculatus TaxID=210409 RepID=UPI001E1CE058|nr:lachesin-like isoform X4 [Portunus trituberculatus]